VAISPDSRVAAVGVNSERNPIVELYNLDSGQKLATLVGHTNRVVWLAFTPDGRRLVSSGFDAVVRVWDLEKHKEARSFKIQIPDSVSLSPDGRLLAARDAEDEKKVRLWNRETGESIRTLNTTAAGACLRTAFTADGKVLVTASTIGTLQLWETETGREIRLIDADTGTVVSIAFTPDGRHLVVGALDGTLRVWNVAAGREVARAEARTRRFNKLAMSPDGRHVITGGGFAWDSALRRVLTDGDYDLHVYRLPEQRSPAPPPLKPRK
jgi:WD40 repeat protein